MLTATSSAQLPATTVPQPPSPPHFPRPAIPTTDGRRRVAYRLAASWIKMTSFGRSTRRRSTGERHESKNLPERGRGRRLRGHLRDRRPRLRKRVARGRPKKNIGEIITTITRIQSPIKPRVSKTESRGMGSARRRAIRACACVCVGVLTKFIETGRGCPRCFHGPCSEFRASGFCERHTGAWRPSPFATARYPPPSPAPPTWQSEGGGA